MKKEIEFDLSVKEAAEWFASKDDEAQAQFFIEVEKIARGWKNSQSMQWISVGRHLLNCECSNQDTRDMIGDINYGANCGK